MELLALILILLFLAAVILPWINMASVSGLRRKLERLEGELNELRQSKGREHQSASVESEDITEPAKPAPVQEKKVPEPVIQEKTSVSEEKSVPAQVEASKSVVSPPPIPETAKVASEETKAEPEESRDWFSKIAVWVGSIALLMAGFYMIKYSIDSGWLTSLVRIWLTTAFGALLCAAGFVIGIRSVSVSNERIGQALSGAGVACLYFASYAAVHMYSFLSAGQGFGAMLGITVLAVGLSLKNGAPIAMMGLVGGFLTPWLMSTGSNDTVMLFSYLFLLFCGAQFLCLKRGWWSLLLLSLVGAYLWSAVVIVGNINGVLDNLEGTLVFVLGICLVNAAWAFFVKADGFDENTKKLLVGVRLMTWGGGLIQGLILVLIGGFAAVDMGLFAILSIGALFLAVIREDEFIWAAWLALAAVLAGALANPELGLWSWMLTPLGLSALFFGVGHWRGVRSGTVLAWRSLSVVSAFVIVPVLYLNRVWIHGADLMLSDSLWLYLSIVGSCLLVLAGGHIFRREADGKVAGEYSAFAVILLGFGLWTYLDSDYYPHAAAILLFVSAIYWKWRDFGRSELVVAGFGAAWAALMALYAASAASYFFSEEMYNAPEQDGLAILAWVAGIVAVATVYGCFRKTWSESLIQTTRWLAGSFSIFGAVAAYQWLDESYMPQDWTAMSVEGGLTTLLALAAVIFVCIPVRLGQSRSAAHVLSILVALRVALLHLPGSGAEGESFFFNALLLQFGVPLLAACVLARRNAEFESSRRVYQVGAMLLGFVWATFLIQDYYGGSRFIDSSNSSTEIYTYSVVWLLLAIVYQAYGLYKNQPAIHVGSLILLLITIGKVFLVDASELEGLFRVLSFLGLGFALIGIGYFYNKVVFARRNSVELADSSG